MAPWWSEVSLPYPQGPCYGRLPSLPESGEGFDWSKNSFCRVVIFQLKKSILPLVGGTLFEGSGDFIHSLPLCQEKWLFSSNPLLPAKNWDSSSSLAYTDSVMDHISFSLAAGKLRHNCMAELQKHCDPLWLVYQSSFHPSNPDFLPYLHFPLFWLVLFFIYFF